MTDTRSSGGTTSDLEQVFEFLSSIEGAGYGGMAQFEIARETMRRFAVPQPANPARLAAALEIWHRFAPESVIEWEDEAHQAEYLLCADAILALPQPISAARPPVGGFSPIVVNAQWSPQPVAGGQTLAQPWGAVMDEMDHQAKYQSATVTRPPQPLHPAQAAVGCDDILSVLYTYRDHQPEEDESWESWYYAAFDLACMKIRELFGKPAITYPQATQGDAKAESSPAPSSWQPTDLQARCADFKANHDMGYSADDLTAFVLTEIDRSSTASSTNHSPPACQGSRNSGESDPSVKLDSAGGDTIGHVLEFDTAKELIAAGGVPFLILHKSDCAMFNGPSLPVRACDCGACSVTAIQREGDAK